tara:strand:- start:87407 stop:88168 length:762 start_codon:yes stop_codon:yes gene_type:complete
VTRPQGQAGALCEALANAGFKAHAQPLLALQPVTTLTAAQKTQLYNLDTYQHIIFASTNAVRFGMALVADYWPQLPVGIQWYAIGTATAKALDEYGVQAHTAASPMTSEALLCLPALMQVSDQRVLIIKGEGGRTTLRDALQARGATVDELACYVRSCPESGPGELAALLDEWQIDIILISSGEGLLNLQALLSPQESTKFNAIGLVVPSARVAQLAQQIGFHRLVIAENASDAAMLRALEEWESSVGESVGE